MEFSFQTMGDSFTEAGFSIATTVDSHAAKMFSAEEIYFFFPEKNFPS